ncbi:MAG TPA: hypothetical protein VJA18_04265 [Candidatus Nanoarchaeia archaeon]|nr:hypothetical protein [Candidatus Nanoarchaeia archaeon]
MSLDSQLRPDDFYARVYKAPKSELKIKEEQVSLPETIFCSVGGSFYSLLGGFLTYALVEETIERTESQQIALGLFASVFVLGGAYFLKHAYVGFQGIISQSWGVSP